MAIRVDGANHIGSAKGYDLFDIITYNAAQQFVNAQSQVQAGADFTQNETTFNRNINDTLHLYFFTAQDTNNVKYAALKAVNEQPDTTLYLKSRKNSRKAVEVNFSLENTSHNNEVAAGDPVPLFLIPDAQGENIDTNGCLISENILDAVLSQFCEADRIDLDMSILPYSESVRSISADAFYYGQDIDNLVLIDNYTEVPSTIISDNVHNVHLTMGETPLSWSARWNAGAEARTDFNYGLSEEDRAAIEAQLQAEREAAERARREEEERIAREAALQAEREARKIRYKVEGDHIVIKGTRKGVTELDIPAEIDGKPVTKIEAYAFFENEDLTKLTLPNTITTVEQGATYGMSRLRRNIYVSDQCVVGKYNPHVRKRSR